MARSWSTRRSTRCATSASRTRTTEGLGARCRVPSDARGPHRPHLRAQPGDPRGAGLRPASSADNDPFPEYCGFEFVPRPCPPYNPNPPARAQRPRSMERNFNEQHEEQSDEPLETPALKAFAMAQGSGRLRRLAAQPTPRDPVTATRPMPAPKRSYPTAAWISATSSVIRIVASWPGPRKNRSAGKHCSTIRSSARAASTAIITASF